MFGAKPSLAVVFVDRNRLQVSGLRGGAVVTMDVPTTLVQDLVVMDRQGLEKHVEAALTRENGPVGPIVMVLAESVYFSRVIAETDEVKSEAATQQFFDSVPFASVIKKTYPQEKGVAVVAANKELIEALTHVFTRAGYSMVSIIPSFVLGTAGAKPSLDEELVNSVRTNSAMVAKFRLDSEKEFSPGATKEESFGERKPKQLFLLLVIFGVFLIIFLVVVVLRFAS